MKKILSTFVVLSLFITLTTQAEEKATLAVTKVGTSTALKADAKTKRTLSTLERIEQSLDANLTSALQATNKFNLLSRTDVDAILKEQNFAESGNVDTAKIAKSGKLKSAKYIATLLVDDFQDYIEKDSFAALEKKLSTRQIRIGIIANIIDTSTGEIIKTANIVSQNSGVSENNATTQTSGGSSLDNLISTIARDVCSQIAIEITNATFPAVIIAKTGKTATFNRNKALGVSVGDEYEIFALGEEMFDPGTGDKLGFEEIPVGKLRVISVTPKFSTGTIIEDHGVQKGQNLRLIKKAPKPIINTSDNEI